MVQQCDEITETRHILYFYQFIVHACASMVLNPSNFKFLIKALEPCRKIYNVGYNAA